MTDDSPRPATTDELKWLNNGFDKEAFEQLDAKYYRRATAPSGSPPPWIFVEADPRELDRAAK